MNKIQGIHPPYIALYFESIRFHCDCALTSVDFVASFIEMTNKTKGNYEMTGQLQNQILDHLQNILIHGAALSRYFWPPSSNKHKTKNKVFKKRGEELRRIFKLTNESPLKDRFLRNELEHFDENLDLYLHDKFLIGHILPAYVGGYQKTEIPLHLFRAYYIDKGVFEVLGKQFEVQPIIDEIYKIYNHISP